MLLSPFILDAVLLLSMNGLKIRSAENATKSDIFNVTVHSIRRDLLHPPPLTPLSRHAVPQPLVTKNTHRNVTKQLTHPCDSRRIVMLQKYRLYFLLHEILLMHRHMWRPNPSPTRVTRKLCLTQTRHRLRLTTMLDSLLHLAAQKNRRRLAWHSQPPL